MLHRPAIVRGSHSEEMTTTGERADPDDPGVMDPARVRAYLVFPTAFKLLGKQTVYVGEGSG